MTRASLVDVVQAERAGYRFERVDAGWLLVDPEGGYLMIGDHGCVAPTKAEAVAEALERIEMDEQEAGWSRGEHQAEARAVEAHQEAKHGDW